MNLISMEGGRAMWNRWLQFACLTFVTGMLGACSDGGGSSNSPAAPTSFTGTATGIIVDSRGNAIANASVNYAGSPAVATVTNSSGQFTLPGIIVSGVSVANGSSITLQVVPPSAPIKYMTATINAVPKAQLTSGGTPSVSSTFNINTGTVQIPAMATVVTGTLTDPSTGGAVANVPLSMAFVGTSFTKITAQSGVTVTLNPSNVNPAQTGPDGKFSFSQAYNDSCLRITVLNYTLSDSSAPGCSGVTPSTDDSSLQFTTFLAASADGINSTVQLNTVSTTAIVGGDTVAPYVSNVEGALDTSSNPEPLVSTVDGVCSTATDGSVSGGVIVDFSEPMAADANGGLTVQSVQIVTGSVSAPVKQTLSSVQLINNNTQLQICTSASLPVPATFLVQILRQALYDQSGNALVLGSVAYDSFTTTSSGASVLSLNLQTTSSSF